jgi:hypothetical protein
VNYYSARGRYRAGCNCATEAGTRDSKIELATFELLSFVMPGGRHDVPFPNDRRMAVDMVFELAPDCRLAIEYDGAYWHEGREEGDARKSALLVDSGFVHSVVRLREEPLDLISRDDVSFAKGAKAAEIVQLTLMHLLDGELLFRYHDQFDRILRFLESSSTRLPAGRIRCPRCLRMGYEWVDDAVGPELARRAPQIWWERGRQTRLRAGVDSAHDG